MAMAEKRAAKEYLAIYNTNDWKLVDVKKIKFN
jgi:hypothetical protein